MNEMKAMLKSIGENLNVDTDSMEVTEDAISFKLKGVRTHAFGPALDRLGDHYAGNRTGRTFSVGEDCICIYGEAYDRNGDTRLEMGVYKVVATKAGNPQILTLSGNGRRKFQIGNHYCLKMNRNNLLDEIISVLNSYYAVATCCCIMPPTNASKSEQDRIRDEYRAKELPKWRKAAKGLIREFRSRWPKS
jgi:hypothetical protein